MKGRRILALALLLYILPLSGCWDKIEIEQRAIINSMIIEKGESDTSDKGSGGPLKVTFGILIPHSQGQGEDMGYSRTVQGGNMAQVINLLGEETSRVPFYGQTRMLILSRDFLKQEAGFKSLLDFIERDPGMNTQMKVLVSKKSAEEITQVEPQLETSTTDHITGILENAERVSGTASISLENLIDSLRETNGSGVVPVLETLPDAQTFRVDELGLIKDYTYIGEVDPDMVKEYKIITDTFSGGRQQVDYNGEKLSVYIYNCKTRKKLKGGSSPSFKIIVEAEGDVDEYTFDKSLMDKKAIEEIEKSVEERMEQELGEATKHFQQDIGYDYLGFGEHLKKYEPGIYNKVKDSWDEDFKNAEIEYEVIFHIRRIGTSK